MQLKSKFLTARKEQGFTLIELLTVIVIIGILAAIAIPVYTSQKGRAQDAAVVSDVRNYTTAMESYLSQPSNSVPLTTAAATAAAQGELGGKVSPNVVIEVDPNSAVNSAMQPIGYTVCAYSTKGKKYTATNVYIYDSVLRTSYTNSSCSL